MKNYYLPTLLLVSTLSFSQSEVLSFSYDSAGNQTIREIICISCRGNSERVSQSNNEEEKFVQSDQYEQISYYPNPVQEVLFIKWQNTAEDFVTAIDVYSLSGQLVRQMPGLDGKESTSVEFLQFSQGTYSVVLIYNSGEKKTLKVIKK